LVGASDYRPTTDAYRLVYLANSLVGMSVTSLVLTYVMQVYGALRERNALGLQLHLLSGETSDAGEMLARLGPCGQISAGYSHLVALGGAMGAMKEAHHFYPVLFYFRFRQPYYSVSAQAHLVLDAVSLIRSTLADENASWLKEAAAVEALWRVARMLVVTLETAFLASVNGGVPIGRGRPPGSPEKASRSFGTRRPLTPTSNCAHDGPRTSRGSPLRWPTAPRTSRHTDRKRPKGVAGCAFAEAAGG
jgi:hypothetical protein